MNRALKWILVGLAGLVALIVIAVVLISLLVDPNDYKDNIAKAVNNATGRTLAIDGSLELSVFPWLGVSLPGMTLSNARGFGDMPFARISGARVGVKLMPLIIRKSLKMDKVALNGLILNLEKNAQGRSNWEDFGRYLSGKFVNHLTILEPAAALHRRPLRKPKAVPVALVSMEMKISSTSEYSSYQISCAICGKNRKISSNSPSASSSEVTDSRKCRFSVDWNRRLTVTIMLEAFTVSETPYL